MKVAIFTHPQFLDSTSMPLFARFLVEGLRDAGHQAEVWSPVAWFHRIAAPRVAKKWLGYLDQFVVFPLQVRMRLQGMSDDTLFVFADQALGPWLPLVATRPHVIHCHDFLALRQALGEIPTNPVSWTGRLYQKWIRAGFRKGRNFTSVSSRTRDELHRFLGEAKPALSVVVPNGLNHPYRPLPSDVAHARLRAIGIVHPEMGFILHVGGNQWYKNRDGVIAIYAAYVARTKEPLPLVMVGTEPTADLREAAAQMTLPGAVEFVVRPSIDVLEAAYSAAAVLLFPSIAEGFGWPILEAMASGCPVLTTRDAPMTEVGGDVADYLPAFSQGDGSTWADDCAERLISVLSRSPEEHLCVRERGIARAQGFTASATLRRYIEVYNQILEVAR